MAHKQRIGVPGADKAYENVLKWLAREEWYELCAETFDEHLGGACDELDVDVEGLEEALGSDTYGVALSCAIEDVLTRSTEAGLNPVDDYLKRRGWRESGPGRRYLEALRDSAMSLYEVVDVAPGSHLVLRDMVRGGEPVRVDDRLGSEKVVIWDRLAARVLEVAGKRVLGGGVLPFGFEAAEAEAGRVRDTCRRGEETLAEKAREEGEGRPPPPREAITEVVLGHWAPHFTRAWLAGELADEEEAAAARTNADGEPLVLAAVRFPLRGATAAIAARLDAAGPTLVRNREQAEEGEATWDWRRGAATAAAPPPDGAAAEGRPAGAGGGREAGKEEEPLGLVVVNENGVVLLTNSVERAERGRALLAELLGGLVGESTVERFPLDEPLGPAAEEGEEEEGAERAAAAAGAAEELDSEALAARIAAANDEVYRGMLAEPVPELDNRTPREVAAGGDEEDRARLVAWLKRLENDDAHLASALGVPAYDFRWMWAELGVADRRR